MESILLKLQVFVYFHGLWKNSLRMEQWKNEHFKKNISRAYFEPHFYLLTIFEKVLPDILDRAQSTPLVILLEHKYISNELFFYKPSVISIICCRKS